MQNNSAQYEAFGQAILEELVLQAGLQQAKNPAADALKIALSFEIRAESAGNCLVIRCDRTGNPSLEVRAEIATTGSE